MYLWWHYITSANLSLALAMTSNGRGTVCSFHSGKVGAANVTALALALTLVQSPEPTLALSLSLTLSLH
jgi:hypothetical protein